MKIENKKDNKRNWFDDQKKFSYKVESEGGFTIRRPFPVIRYTDKYILSLTDDFDTERF